jgi:hypothetical protein
MIFLRQHLEAIAPRIPQRCKKKVPFPLPPPPHPRHASVPPPPPPLALPSAYFGPVGSEMVQWACVGSGEACGRYSAATRSRRDCYHRLAVGPMARVERGVRQERLPARQQQHHFWGGSAYAALAALTRLSTFSRGDRHLSLVRTLRARNGPPAHCLSRASMLRRSWPRRCICFSACGTAPIRQLPASYPIA